MDVRDELLKVSKLLESACDAPPRERIWQLVVAHGLLQDAAEALHRELAEAWPDAHAQRDRAPETVVMGEQVRRDGAEYGGIEPG